MFQKRVIVGLTVFLILCIVSSHVSAQEETATESAELPTLTVTPTPSEPAASPTPSEIPSLIPSPSLSPTETLTPVPSPLLSPTGESTPTPPPVSEQGETAESPPVPPIYPPGSSCPVGQAPLSTELFLLQALPDGPIQVPVVSGVHYLFRVSGTYTPDLDGNAADAQYFSDDLWNNPGLTHNLYADFGAGLGPVDWGEYTPTHEYEFYYQPTTSHVVSFMIRDFSIIEDNYGTLLLNLYECMTLTSVPPDEEEVGSFPTPTPTAPASVPTTTPGTGSTSSSDPTSTPVPVATTTPTPDPTSRSSSLFLSSQLVSDSVISSKPSSTPTPTVEPTDGPADPTDHPLAVAGVLGAASAATCRHCQWIVFAAMQSMILAAIAYVTMKLNAERSLFWYGIAGLITTVLAYGAFILYHLSCAVRVWHVLWYVSSPDLLCRCFGIIALVIFIISLIVIRVLGSRTVTIRYPAFARF